MRPKSKLITSRIIYILVILAFGFLAWRVAKDWKLVSNFKWQFNPVYLLIAVILSFAAYFLNIYVWHLLTKALSLKVSLRDNLKIWIYSNLTRFLPGKIWQFPSRVLLLSENKIKEIVSGSATFIEVILNFSSAALVVFVSYFFWKFPPEIAKYRPILIVFALAPLAVIVLFQKKSLTLFAGLYQKLTKRKIEGLDQIKLPLRWIIPLILVFAIRFLFSAGIFLFLIRAFFQIPTPGFAVILGAVSFSWLLGYISFFAPAGLGVAEISLASLIVSVVPFAMGSIIAVFYRLLVVITEAIFLGIQLAFFSRKKSSAI